MSTSVQDPPPETVTARSGPFGRLGLAVATHTRWVIGIWLIVLVALGAAAPSVFSSLAGAGWQDNGSDSVQARELAQEHFGGNASSAIQVVVNSDTYVVTDPEMTKVFDQATELLSGDSRVGEVIPPQPGMTISQDEHTGILIGGADADTDEMVRAVDDLKDPLANLSTGDIQVFPTGASALWSDFNAANHDAMIKAELISWPVTLAIMIIAFGSLVAAGLPLLLTISGLVASAGALVLLNTITPISVWAMNFALMFALALGIDYALFMVSRFRGALRASGDPRQAVAETMDTAGKAVALSGLTVLISLSAVLLVPAPAVRTMAVGIMLAVTFVLAATLTLLPTLLAKMGPKINAGKMPWVKKEESHRSEKFAAWGGLLDRHPWPFALGSVAILLVLAFPILGLKVAMPSIQVVPEDSGVRQGYEIVQAQMGDGAPGALQVLVPTAQADEAFAAAEATDGIAMVSPPMPSMDGSDWAMLQAIPTVDPSDAQMSTILTDLRTELPDEAFVGGAPAENLDLQEALNNYLPLIVGIILLLGFALLLVALRAPLIALLGTVTSLLSTAATFGVARLIFQDGHGASLLGFEPQGFLNGWGPVFFFAMIFAIAMDYTVFLLSTAKEQYEKHGDARRAAIGGLAHSGRVIFAAAAVMVAVFFSFALAEPLPPKEMGIILGVAVLLDALLIRLILLPVLMRLTGSAAWHTPAWLDKILPKITFSHD